MSEYANIEIENMTLFSFRNYVSPDIVRKIFSNKDLMVIPNYIEDEEDEDAENYTRYLYKTTVFKAKERLDAQGYTLSKLEDIFNSNRNQVIDYSSFLCHLHIDFDEIENKAKERINKYDITFKQWTNSMNKIVKYELKNGNIWQENKNTKKNIGVNTECDKIIYYSLTNTDKDSFYALYTDIIDTSYITRLILESCDNDAEILLDFTYLQYWDEDCVSKAISATEDIEKTIVLVEGSSDKDILEFSMNQLFPHLSDLFYFMDFDDNNGKRGGGTSYIVKNLKIFYFSKIKRNFIAIFDNDAEGYNSKCLLLNNIKKWPSNFKILLYPQIDFFKNYPTIAPNGDMVLDDINKKAASIELYLPDSIIKNENNYFPVEWESRKKIKNNGQVEALYQGVISNKDEIKGKFHKMKNDILSGKSKFKDEEWNRMKVLLESIVFAYR